MRAVRLLLDLVPELLVEQRALSWSRGAAASATLDRRQPRRGDRRAAGQSRGSVPALPLPHHHELRQFLPQAPQSRQGHRGDQEHDGGTEGLSGLRALGPDFDPGVVGAVDARLGSVAERESAVVLLAVESGSRAWGFPSPDSDYDCRFIYARARDDYLRLYPPRDVIEFPLDRVLDVNGWDLAKALRLLLKGNAVVIEWLTSPFVYAGDEKFREQGL